MSKNYEYYYPEDDEDEYEVEEYGDYDYDNSYFNEKEVDLRSTPAIIVRYGFVVLGIVVLVFHLIPFSSDEIAIVFRFFVILGMIFAAFMDKIFLPRSRVYDF